MATCGHTGDLLVDPVRFVTSEDVNSRLRDSYIRYKGKPHYVAAHQVSDICIQDVLDSNSKPFWVHSSSTLLDLSSPPLGYVFDHRRCRAFYLSRSPRRRWKMGADNGNVLVSSSKSDDERITLSNINAKDVGKCIAGDYPSLKIALKMLRSDTVHGVPVSRVFALEKLDKSLLLFYKNVLAGVVEVLDDRAAVVLMPDFNHSEYIKKLADIGIGINNA